MNINIEKDMQKAIKAAAKEARRAAKAEARAVKEAKKQERRDRLARHGRFLSPNGRNWSVSDKNGGTIKTPQGRFPVADRKSTRLNSSHVKISYAVFCLKKKNTAEQKGDM